MSDSSLCMSVRFLDTTFHGRRDRGEPEWPPSPLRMLQALVAVAGRIEPRGFSEATREALIWLGGLPPPIIVAPSARRTIGRRSSVPNNAMDVVARLWSRGNESDTGDADPRTHRTMKTVRPLWLDGDCVSFVWSLDSPPTAAAKHVEQLQLLGRRVHVLGWGTDLVVGDVRVLSAPEVEALNGERWLPTASDGQDGLRVPTDRTLDDLVSRHIAFCERLGSEGFVAPPPLSQFAVVSYRRTTDHPSRPFAAYLLLSPETEGFRAFSPTTKGLTVAGMMRHAVKSAAEAAGWDETKIARVVLGHGEARGARHEASGTRRFAYLPLPSIEARGEGLHVVGRVRRVMLTTFGEDATEELNWARQSLTAQELVDERTKAPVALLSLAPRGDAVVRRFVAQSPDWVSVTPVVLPGYDDPGRLRRRAMGEGVTVERKRSIHQRLGDRIDALVRKALRQSGFTSELAEHADLEWSKVGFVAGVDHGNRYGVPEHIQHFPRYHVRIKFRDPQGEEVRVPGPICLGAGRYFGLGIFVAE